MPRARVCGQPETILGGYHGLVNAFGFLSSLR